MPTELLTERRGAVLIVTLSGPATRNALSPQVYAAGTEALHVAEANPEVRCVILTGAGGQFCAGRDMTLLAQHRARGLALEAAQLDAFHQWVTDLRSFPKPVLAAVEGVAAGSGVSLMLACDLVVASESAQFISGYSDLALSPDGGLSWHMSQALPRSEALSWLWGQASFNAQQMRHWGLVQQVVPTGQALTAALNKAQALAGLSPSALATTKELLQAASSSGTFATHLDKEKHHFMVHLAQPDTGQALENFFNRKKPLG